MLAVSAVLVGQLLGMLALIVLGVALAVVGFRRWQSTNAVTTTLATPLPAIQPTQSRGTPSSPRPPAMPGAEDSFFGGRVTTAATGVPAGVNPAVTDTRYHPSYGSAPARPVPSQKPVVAVLLMVVGLGLASAATFQGYTIWANSRAILTLPDQLLGMERVDEDSVLGQLVEEAKTRYVRNDVLSDMQMAAYGDPTQFVFVTAGEVDEASGYEGDFFSGATDGLASAGVPDMELSAVDPGPKGGDMRCVERSAEQVSICAWVSSSAAGNAVVVGVAMFTGTLSSDYADATRTIRDQIED